MKNSEIIKILKSHNIAIPGYTWIARWSKLNLDISEILILSKDLQCVPKNMLTSMSEDMFILRYGSILGKEKFKEYSDNMSIRLKKLYAKKRSEGTIITTRMKEHWIKKGYSEKEAKDIITNISKKSGKKSWNTRVERGTDIINTQLRYYLRKGYSEDEAKVLLRDRQTTFSLEKCIARHGYTDGVNIFNTRQSKWLKTLNSKSKQEKLSILIKKMTNSKRIYSKEGVLFFDKLIKSIGIDKRYCSYGDSEVYIINEDRIYFYDFCYEYKDIRLIIEYHGVSWHPKPGQYDWKNPINPNIDYEYMSNIQKTKRIVAEAEGYIILEIYSDYNHKELSNLERRIEEIIN